MKVESVNTTQAWTVFEKKRLTVGQKKNGLLVYVFLHSCYNHCLRNEFIFRIIFGYLYSLSYKNEE